MGTGVTAVGRRTATHHSKPLLRYVCVCVYVVSNTEPMVLSLQLRVPVQRTSSVYSLSHTHTYI